MEHRQDRRCRANVPWAATIVFGFRCWTCVFFAAGTLFGIGRFFDLFDTILKFLFQDFFEEISSIDEEKVVVKRFPNRVSVT